MPNVPFAAETKNRAKAPAVCNGKAGKAKKAVAMKANPYNNKEVIFFAPARAAPARSASRRRLKRTNHRSTETQRRKHREKSG